MREFVPIGKDRIFELKRPFAVGYPNYLLEPEYGAVTPQGFGSAMTVVLTPNAGMLPAGTPTKNTSLGDIMRKLRRRETGVWIAGHLLNADLGGSGTEAENLVPLTRTANAQHSRIESIVKRLCVKMRQKHNLYDKRKDFLYCVKYTVKSVGTFGDFEPYDLVPSHLVVDVKVCKFHWKEQELETITNGHLLFDENKVFHLEVHNRDEDILRLTGLKEPKKRTRDNFLQDQPKKRVHFSQHC